MATSVKITNVFPLCSSDPNSGAASHRNTSALDIGTLLSMAAFSLRAKGLKQPNLAKGHCHRGRWAWSPLRHRVAPRQNSQDSNSSPGKIKKRNHTATRMRHRDRQRNATTLSPRQARVTSTHRHGHPMSKKLAVTPSVKSQAQDAARHPKAQEQAPGHTVTQVCETCHPEAQGQGHTYPWLS